MDRRTDRDVSWLVSVKDGRRVMCNPTTSSPDQWPTRPPAIRNMSQPDHKRLFACVRACVFPSICVLQRLGCPHGDHHPFSFC